MGFVLWDAALPPASAGAAMLMQLRGTDMRKPRSEVRSRKKSNAKPSQADVDGQLESFLDKYDPEVATFARRTLEKMRKLLPGAIEMVYDNYNWLVVGFSPTERPSEAIFR